MLLALVVLPCLVVAYVVALRKRRPTAVTFSDLALIREALPIQYRWHRHIPFVLLILSGTCLITAAARPQIVTTAPISRTTIILAIDVSRSMCAVDVEPNRLGVAQVAAQRFVTEQVESTPIGLVTFAGSSQLLVPPTRDAGVLTGAIDALTTSFGTAIGSATFESIDAIAAINPDVAPSGVDLAPPGTDPAVTVEPVPDVVVVLTDGANSSGKDPLKAAAQAAARGVRVYTIGFGTTEPTSMVCSTQQAGVNTFADERFDPSGGAGFVDFVGAGANTNARQLLVIDEPTLQAIASETGGSYYRAENADQLNQVFSELPTQLVLAEEQIEISVVFTASGALLAILALLVSWLRLRPVKRDRSE